VKAWQYACSNRQLLPASHKQLLQTLGCDSRTILWFAASWAGHMAQVSKQPQPALDTMPVEKQLAWDMQGAVMMLRQVHSLIVDHHAEASQQQQQPQEQSAGTAGWQLLPASEVEVQVYLLLPAVLLYLCAHYPLGFGCNGREDLSRYALASSLECVSMFSAQGMLAVPTMTAGAVSQEALLQELTLLALMTGRKLLIEVEARRLASNSSSSGGSGNSSCGSGHDSSGCSPEGRNCTNHATVSG
jgi:hypothetical protein